MHPIPRYQLGPFTLEPATRTLATVEGAELHLAQKPFLVLVHLVENRHRLVTREELLQRFWAGGDVYDQALTRCLSSIRKALDDQSDPARFIETRWAEGYRYIGPCEALTATAPAAPAPTERAAAPAASSAPVASHGPAAARPDAAPDQAPPRENNRRLVATFAVVLALLSGAAWWLITSEPDLASVRRIGVHTRFEGAPDDAWMAQALPAQMLRTVSRIEGLTFLTGDAAASAADAQLDLELALDAERFALKARLRAPDGRTLWTFKDSFARAEMMKVERHLLRAMVGLTALPVREPPPRVRSEAAYLSLIKGFALLDDRACAAPELGAAIAEFQTTLQRDPGNAQALAGIAEAELRRGACAGARDDAALARARASAVSANESDPDLARAQMVLGELAALEGDATSARAHLDRAVELDPGDASVRRARSRAACAAQRTVDCLADAALAVALAPGSREAAVDHLAALVAAGRAEDAERLRTTAQARWPGDARFVP